MKEEKATYDDNELLLLGKHSFSPLLHDHVRLLSLSLRRSSRSSSWERGLRFILVRDCDWNESGRDGSRNGDSRRKVDEGEDFPEVEIGQKKEGEKSGRRVEERKTASLDDAKRTLLYFA